MKPWSKTRLEEVLTHYQEYIEAPEPREYRKLSVKLYGKGVVIDTPTDGAMLKMKRHQLAKAGQVILSEIWGKKGAIGFVPPAGEGALCTSHFFLFDVREDRLDRRWLRGIFDANYLQEQLDAEAKGTTGYAAVRPKNLLACEIPLPPLAEQQRVVARIEKLAAQIHEARTLRQQSAEEAEALPTAQTTRIFEELLRGERHPIGTLGTDGENPIQIGPFGAQLHKTEFVEDGVPVLNVGNVWPDGLNLDYLDHVTEEKAHQLRRYSIRAGDLLFARSGATLGKVCLVPPECDSWLMTGHLFRVRFDRERVFNRFAFAALRGSLQIQDQIFGQIRGATRPGYNTTLLGTVELPVPPLPEQRRIVAELDGLQAEVDALKRLQAETAAELDALLPALLDRAFKGEL